MRKPEYIPFGDLEGKYYAAFFRGLEQGSLIAAVRGDFTNRLFVKENHTAVFSYLIAWYTGIIKAKLFPQIR